MTRETAIKAITAAGGIPVLAHPMLYGLNYKETDALVGELCEMGLKGIETYYSSNMGFDEDNVRSIALKYKLIMTGGTDFHGSNKPGLEIGTGRNNNMHVPKSAYEELFKYKGLPVPEI